MVQVMTTLVVGLGPPLTALIVLAMQLRSEALHDQRRKEVLDTLTSHTPTSAMIELNDVRNDGSHLRVRITPSSMTPAGER
jgi:hypothetical protein